jgi:hypothetical protein
MANLQVKNIDRIGNEKKIHLSNVLLIYGEGRNVGKTTLGCRIIERLSRETKVIALKVSPHFHKLNGSLILLKGSDSLTIARETDKNSGKDSSRYLNAGAEEVYYIQSEDNGLALLAAWIRDNIPDSMPVVCESGGLSRAIQPGYIVHLRRGIGRNGQSHQQKTATIFNNDQPENVDIMINWQNNSWQK